MLGQPKPYIINLKNLTKDELELSGREAFFTSFLYQNTLNVPSAFVITSRAFDDFLTAAQLVEPLSELINSTNFENLSEISKQIKALITQTTMPSIIERPMVEAYKNLGVNNLPFVALEISNIIESEYFPKKRHNHFAINVYGNQQFIDLIKLGWAELFSTEALKLRLEKNYEGVLTTSIIVQKMIRPEVSGKVYKIGSEENKFVYLSALYGLDSLEEIHSDKDVYKIDFENMKIVEKNIVHQNDMVIRKGKIKLGEDPNVKVKLSLELQRDQKISDERILRVVNIYKELAENLKGALDLSWGIEAGEINIFGLYSNNLDTKFKKNTKRQPEINPKYSEENLKTKNALIENLSNQEVFVERASQSSQTNLVNEVQEQDTQTDQIVNEINPLTKNTIGTFNMSIELITKIYINSGKMTSEILNEVSTWGNVFIDANDLFLNAKVLPELLSKDIEFLNLIKSCVLQINNIARFSGNNEVLYSFSSISEEVLTLLGLSYSDNDGFYDERFLNNEKYLSFEASIVKKLRNEVKLKNISVVLSGLRTHKNLIKIKKHLVSEGLRKSPSFKIYAELAIPSFFHEISKLDDGDIDGIIIDFEKLTRNLLLKNIPTEVDYLQVIGQINSIRDLLFKKKLSLLLKLQNNLSKKVFAELIALQSNGIIVDFKLDDDYLKIIQDTEKESFKKVLVPAIKPGRKIKNLT